MVWLPTVKIIFDDIFSHFDTIPACDRQVYGQTDISQWCSLRYA